MSNSKSCKSLFVVFLALLLTGVSMAQTADQKREMKSLEDWESDNKELREIKSNEYYLVSFKKSITQNEFLVGFGVSDLSVTAVHVCDTAGGITAFFTDSSKPPSEQLTKIRNEVRNQANSAIMQVPSVRGDERSSQASREDQIIKEDFRLCGAEIKSSRANAVELKKRLYSKIRSIELTQNKIRKLPIYTKE